MSFELLLLIPAAFLAGVLMFLAPCTLPIVPGYLAFIAGGRGRVIRNAVAFVIGFSIIFILLGTFAGLLGGFIKPWQEMLTRLAGAIIIFLGLTMLGYRIPFLSLERHITLPSWLRVGRIESSFLIGSLFAVGWSPCIGPVLGTILLVASASATALMGALLLAVFSLGLAIPFLLCAIFLERAGALFARWERFSGALSLIGGGVLVLIGALMLTGSMASLITWGFGFFDFLGYDRLLEFL